MIKIRFLNVGQGDSLILEWENEGAMLYGIIDAHIYDGVSPTLKYIESKSIENIEFIILSHLHFDHFSAIADLFEYFIANNIKVNYFCHTIAPLVGDIYDKIYTTQALAASIVRFFETYEKFDKHIKSLIHISSSSKSIPLDDNTTLEFYAPDARIYEKMSIQLSRKRNIQPTTHADINKLSCIIALENKTNAVILSADSVKMSFRMIRNLINKRVELIQIPHHGSRYNIDEKFWSNLQKIKNAPAIISAGDEPKDKIPDKETVEYFDKLGFKVYSTNPVYGIEEYFNLSVSSQKAVSASKKQNAFSRKVSTYSPYPNNRFSGDQVFDVL